MKKRKKGSALTVLIVLLCIALAVVIGVIAYKQYEYSVSADYYNSLRGWLPGGRAA